MEAIPSLKLHNIIGIDALDVDVRPKLSLSWYPRYDILVFDPGLTVGWAGYGHLHNQPPTIEVGQGSWDECLRWNAERVFVETTPYAERRTFDPWPIRFDGAVRAKMFPQEPEPVFPSNLKPARQWFKLPRGHGVGRHAKDALTHLVALLVREAAR